MLPALASVSAWATGQRYDPAAVNTFLMVADYYLVAHALAHGHTVVTHEKAAPAARKTIKIPDVCIGLGIKCMTPFECFGASAPVSSCNRVSGSGDTRSYRFDARSSASRLIAVDDGR